MENSLQSFQFRQLEAAEAKLFETFLVGGTRVVAERPTVGAYRLYFKSPVGAEINVRILLHDQTGSDIVFTHFIIHPDKFRKNKLGSMILKKVLDWAQKNNLSEIRATQVRPEAEHFWTKNGFVKVEGSATEDYILTLI